MDYKSTQPQRFVVIAVFEVEVTPIVWRQNAERSADPLGRSTDMAEDEVM